MWSLIMYQNACIREFLLLSYLALHGSWKGTIGSDLFEPLIGAAHQMQTVSISGVGKESSVLSNYYAFIL